VTIDTKTRILDAAEMRFAEHGYSATSLRDITTLADANLASVNYHFGSKEDLLKAVFHRRVVPVNNERLRLLDDAEAKAEQGPLDVELVVRAFLLPAFQAATGAGPGEPKFMQLVGRMHSETNSDFRDVFLQLFVEVRERFGAALKRARPDLGGEEVMSRLHFMIGALAHTLVWEQCCSEVMAPPARERNELLEALTRFSVAGMRSAGVTSTAPARATRLSRRRHGRATRRPYRAGERV
jgi:AcrR family transcriptional regulator